MRKTERYVKFVGLKPGTQTSFQITQKQGGRVTWMRKLLYLSDQSPPSFPCLQFTRRWCQTGKSLNANTCGNKTLQNPLSHLWALLRQKPIAPSLKPLGVHRRQYKSQRVSTQVLCACVCLTRYPPHRRGDSWLFWEFLRLFLSFFLTFLFGFVSLL